MIHGRRDTLQQAARKEFEAGKAETDPEIVRSFLVCHAVLHIKLSHLYAPSFLFSGHGQIQP